MANSSKTIHSLVLDSGPLIKNDYSASTLLALAEVLYTTPLVIDEIRDAPTRARLMNTLLPLVKLRSPRPASIKIIQDFARKTGDLEVLSKVDVTLIALTYELECERNNGDWRLRSIPGQKKINGYPPTLLCENQLQSTMTALTELAISTGENRGQEVINLNEQTSLSVEPGIQEGLSSFDLSTDKPQASSIDKSTNSVNYKSSSVPAGCSSPEQIVAQSEDNSDQDGWITTSNLKKHQEVDANSVSSPIKCGKVLQVALLTNDYAMQNVSLRINLNVLSASLQRISNLRSWVLRCHACFLVTRDMTKQFCGRCGKPTLLRVACTTDRNGDFKIHLKKNMQWNSRGDIYSIPKPRAGTSSGKPLAKDCKGEWGKRLILVEDQKENLKFLEMERRRKEKNLMDEDFLPNLLSGERGRNGSRPAPGAGRNINSRKRK